MAVKYKINGREVSLEEFRRGARGIEPGHPPGGHSSKCWPMLSHAMGGPPSQAEELERRCAAQGVPTEFCRKTGAAILTSNGHRNRLMKANGIGDLDAGYNQRAPK